MRLIEIVLLAFALLFFLLAGFGWVHPRISQLQLIALGLMCWVIEVLVVMLG